MKNLICRVLGIKPSLDPVIDLYKEVHSHFPETRFNQHMIRYDWNVWVGINYDISKFDGALVGDEPYLVVGAPFFTLKEEEKKGAIAHELGHFERFLYLTDNGVEEYFEKHETAKSYFDISKDTPIADISWEVMNSAHWYTDNEIIADEVAVRIGYLIPLLKILKVDENNKSWILEHAMDTRIENLEQRLREELLR